MFHHQIVCTCLLCLILSLITLSPDPTDTRQDAWDRVLSAAGLTKETCRFDMLDMGNYGGQEFLLSFFSAIHQDPLRIPFYVRIFRQNVLSAASSLGDLAMLGGLRIGEGTRRNLLGDPNREESEKAGSPDALLSAIREIHRAGGSPLTPSQEQRLRPAIERLPADVEQNAAFLLLVELKAIRWRNRALSALAGHNLGQVFHKLIGFVPDVDETLDDEISTLRHRIDLKFLLTGGTDLAIAVDRVVADLMKRTGAERFSFRWQTPLGHILLNGVGDTTYRGDIPYLLIMDAGGNDTYYGGGATFSSSHPASVLIDLSGDDRYLEAPELAQTPVGSFAGRKKKGSHPVFGAGVLGYGILADASGRDLYRGLNNTQGRGLFGLGILQDRGGDDRYDNYTTGQGSATFGVGVLADLSGKDEYRCFTTSQGFGDTKGFGLLVDRGEEDDLFEANDVQIDFPSAQTKEHNANLAQGAGFGRRADYLDGHSLAGGVGALVDGGGKNLFAGGLFCQGAGYWYGAGILCAGKGEDTYRGIWYVQGASAHFAVGALYDEGGDDRYTATMNMAQGAGHDFGPGFLIDEAGNDRHEAPNLSLGGGNANGFGFYWDKSGDDVYIVQPSATLGRASIEASGRNSIRERNLTLGIFLDTGGTDLYPAALPWAKDNALWTMAQSGGSPLPSARGAGLDTEQKETPEPR